MAGHPSCEASRVHTAVMKNAALAVGNGGLRIYFWREGEKALFHINGEQD